MQIVVSETGRVDWLCAPSELDAVCSSWLVCAFELGFALLVWACEVDGPCGLELETACELDGAFEVDAASDLDGVFEMDDG